MKFGTLEQIGAQVGDTVEDVCDGMMFEIELIEGSFAHGETTYKGELPFNDKWRMNNMDTWCIISKSGFIEVGGVYVSGHSEQWECVAINGGRAWARVLGREYAYEFNLDGTPVHTDSAHTLKPMQETKDLCVDGEKIGTIDVVNGKLDFNTVKGV